MPKKVISITKGKFTIKKIIRGNTEYIYVVEKAKKPKKVKIKKPIKKIKPSISIPKPKATIPIPKVEEPKAIVSVPKIEKETTISRPLGKSLPPQEIHSIAQLTKKFQKFLYNSDEILHYVRRYTDSREEFENLTDIDIRNILEKKAREGDDEAYKYLEKYKKLLYIEGDKIRNEIKRVEEITGEPFIKKIYGSPEPSSVSVGYLGLQEGEEQHYIIEIPSVDYLEKTLSLFYIPYPSKEEMKELITKYIKLKNPNLKDEEIEWYLKYAYPLEKYGFRSVVSSVVSSKGIRKEWEYILTEEKYRAIDELKERHPALYNQIAKKYSSSWDAYDEMRRKVDLKYDEVKKEILEKYGNSLEDPEKVKEELYTRLAEEIIKSHKKEMKTSGLAEKLQVMIETGKIPAKTSSGLQDEYERINKQYFGDGLPRMRVYLANLPDIGYRSLSNWWGGIIIINTAKAKTLEEQKEALKDEIRRFSKPL